MKKKIAIFDIDGTIFRNSLLIELHWKLVKEGAIRPHEIKSVDRLYWAWVERRGTYEEYLNATVKNFDRYVQGVPVVTLERLAKKVVDAQSKIVYRYTRDLIAKLKRTHLLVAISGSPVATVKAFTGAWGFDYAFGTLHEIKNGRYGKKKFVASRDKQALLKKFVRENGLSLAGSVAVGDTESDASMLELVAKPICFNPNKKLYDIAKKRGWKVVVERKDVVYEL